MSTNTKRNKRPGGGNRMGRGMRGPDKSTIIEGVYSNGRFTHAAVNLIGSFVQVQVKNGATYEGVFKAFSAKMEVVLEMAHRLEEGANSKNPTVPSKETVVNKIIFKQGDIIMLTALDVDLDYASKDTFIDSGISKFNGQVTEKELQPWDGEIETASGIEGLEAASGDSANGWDANEMFKTNAEQFNVKSSYDPDLTQYTTPLKPQNTKEYKKREQEAARLALEIEKTEGFRARADLENGDGDEEKKFSAVIRETGPENLQGLGIVSGGKYVPPHLRKPVPAVNNNRGYKQGPPPSGPPPGPSQTSPNKPRTHQPHREESEVKVNGDNKEEKVSESQDRSNTSETNIDHKADCGGKDMPSSVASKVDRKNSNPKARDVQIQELKEFSTKFKLSDNESKERERSQSQPGPPPQPTVAPQNTGHMVTGAASPPSRQLDKPEDKKGEEKDKQHDKTFKNVKSTLNPNAKEFVFNPNAKPFTPKHAAQIPTPPRPHTQSPVIVPQQMPSMQGPPIYGPVYSMPATQQPRFTKKATVSVQRPDFNNAAHAAAAATGPPLLAQTAPQYTFHYMTPQQVVGSGATVQPMYPQMVQVAPGTRMVNPHSMVPQQSHPNSEQVTGMPPGGPAQHQVYVTQQPGAQAVPAHMSAHPPGAQGHPLPTPGHVAPHTHPTPPHSQPSHMNSQSAGPPAPSPVHQHPGPGHQPQQSHPHPQAHPPSSGTPQPPHILYPNTQMGPQGHPPLQPSPHTPTSPQSMHPQGVTFPYPYTSQAAIQNASQMTYAHSHQHNTITHGQQQHTHSTHAPTQIVMMPGQGSGQLQQPGHPGQVQHVHAMQGHHMQGPGPVPGQGPHMVPHSGVATITVSTPTQQNLHPQMHYVAQQQMASQGPPQPVQGYPLNQ